MRYAGAWFLYFKLMSPAHRPDPFTASELLWRTEGAPVKAERPRLGVDSILASAIAIADAEGLDALSMQRIASELGYTPMALYRHVPSKAHLVAAMTDTAYGTPPVLTSRRPSWRAEVESWVIALWRLYERHPWLVRTPTTTAPVGPNALAWTEALLRPLDRAGLTGGDLLAAATFVSSAVRDLARISSELDPAAAADYGRVLAERLDRKRYPLMAELTANATFDNDQGDVAPMVWFGLQRLLDGIDAYATT
jgi:AcrR family transcriptional regulator